MIRTVTMGAAVAALVAASLLATPGEAKADPGGKWWTPKQGRERRVEGVYRRDSAPRGFSRQWRSWGDRRVYRDRIVIRASRGPRYQAWRTYCPPEYIYSRHVIRVRPIRFVVAAMFGGVRFQGSYHDDDCLYGCNFCDARFSSYGAYYAHVQSCAHRPQGYRVQCSDWGSAGDWGDDGWRNLGDRDPGYDRSYDRGYDRGDDGRCDKDDDGRYDRGGRWDDDHRDMDDDDDYDR